MGLADEAVLAEDHAVVAEQQDERVLEEVQFLHPVHKAPEPAVHHRQLAGVEGVHPVQLRLRQVVARTVDRGVGLRSFGPVGVHVRVLLRRVPGGVGVVDVHGEEEGPHVLGRLQKLRGAVKDPGGEPVLLALSVGRVGEVLGEVLLAARARARVGYKGPLEALGGARPDRTVLVRRLAAEKVPHVEAPVHVVGGFVLLQVVGHEQVQVPVLPQDLSERNLVERYRLPAPEGDVLPLRRVPVPKRPRPGAGVDGPAGADGRGRLGVGPREAQALPRQGVEVGSLDPVVPVGPDVVLAQRIHDDKDDVLPPTAAGSLQGFLFDAPLRIASAGAEHGQPRRPGPRRLQEISSRKRAPQSRRPLRSSRLLDAREHIRTRLE